MKTLLVISCLLLVACQPVVRTRKQEAHKNKLERLDWLIGKWVMQTPEGVITEEWLQPVSDTQWSGLSYMVSQAGDTSFSEQIRLSYQGDSLFYLPVVSNQNDGKAVSFAERSFSDSLIVFENRNHDFPQRIMYKRISDTSILASIEGIRNGQNRKEEFAYTRK